MASLSTSPPSSSTSPPTPTPLWPRLVRQSLAPRLARLPVLTLAFLHAAVVVAHVALTLAGRNTASPTSVPSLLLAALKPTLVVASLAAFTLGVLPALVVRRRLLSRPGLEKLLCAQRGAGPAPINVAPGQAISADSLPAQLLHALAQRSTWLAALLHALTSILFTTCVAASFALYSPDIAWWMPYHLVPSTRRTTGSFGRVVSTTQVYWRPNEVFWCLVVQPAFVGAIASVASSCAVQMRRQRRRRALSPPPPPRIPPWPPSLLECLAPDVSVKTSLTSRITGVVPARIMGATALYAGIAAAVFALYLPLRLPLFRAILAVLPPYSTLRRLCIPTLRTGHGLTASSNLLPLLLASVAISAIQGATLAIANTLWEIYATHPMAVVVSAPKPMETLLAAIESNAPGAAATSSSPSSPAERQYLFTHALFDLTALSTDTTTHGAERRRAFFKHFAAPSTTTTAAAATTSNGTVSAWERLSEVLIGVVNDAVRQMRDGGKQQQPASTSNPSNASKATTSTTPAGKQLQVKSGGVIGTATAVAPTTAASPTTTTSASATTSATAATAPSTTVWQRLVAPTSQASGSSGSGGSGSNGQSKPPPPPSTSTPPPPPASWLTSLTSTAIQAIPGAHALVSRIVAAANATSPSSPSLSSPTTSRVTTLPPLALILIAHSVSRLLPLSLQEDEWGSVTLSERRGLGVEGWVGGRSSGGGGGGGALEKLRLALGDVQSNDGGDDDEATVLALLLKAELEGGMDRTRRAFGMTV